VLQSTRAVPGVVDAAASFLTPVSGMGWNSTIETPELASLPERERTVWFNAVTPGFFRTYGTRLVAGRDFTAADRKGGVPVAVVNEAFVRAYVKKGTPLGRRFKADMGPNKKIEREIVGVVQDAAYRSLRDAKPPTVYVAFGQENAEFVTPNALAIRAAPGLRPMTLSRSVTDAIGRVDANLSLTFRPLREQVDDQLVRERLVALMSGFFGVLALAMAGVGLYGVTAYAVSCRRTEIGVRMALGADTSRVVRLVVGRVARLVAVGVIIGVGISLWAAKFAAALLYGLEPRDTLTIAGASVALAIVAALAAWLPARRAARIDPAEVLRSV